MQQQKIYNVLVVCTGNSARSILGEVLFNAFGKGRFVAWSAGSKPVGKVNPFALALLQQSGYSIEGLRSKSWDEFAAPGGPDIDFIFTVCDSAAGEPCPAWPGHPATAHWGMPDPAQVEGSDEVKRVFGAGEHAHITVEFTLLVSAYAPISSAALYKACAVFRPR